MFYNIQMIWKKNHNNQPYDAKIKNFADKGVEICVKIFYPASGGAAKISDA